MLELYLWDPNKPQRVLVFKIVCKRLVDNKSPNEKFEASGELAVSAVNFLLPVSPPIQAAGLCKPPKLVLIEVMVTHVTPW